MDVKSFNNSQSIKSINVRHHKITFTFEDDVTLSMNAVGECCSYSYFKQVAGYDFQDLVGRRIVKFTVDGPFRSEKRNNYGEIRRFKGYKFILDNDSDFKFFLINDSNGWYTGWIEINGSEIFNHENSGDNISTLDDKELPDSTQEDIEDEDPTTIRVFASTGHTGHSASSCSSGPSGPSGPGGRSGSSGPSGPSGGYNNIHSFVTQDSQSFTEDKYGNEYVIITRCEVEPLKSTLNPNAKPFIPKGY